MPKSTYWQYDDETEASEKDVIDIILDYIRITRKLKRKIKISFKSAKKLKAAHDEAYIIYQSKSTPLIKIPKNSVFNELRKLLPQEFEWIKTRQRIVEEGYNMCHCVATYADDINKDRCAIYSYISGGERYTLEFTKRRNKYMLRQMHGKYNSNPPKEIIDYVKKIIYK
jgi:hypothetical protein